MKLIRLTDDHYMLDMGSTELRPDEMEMLREAWKDWWDEGRYSSGWDYPRLMVLGTRRVKLMYEDRRAPDELTELRYRIQQLEEIVQRLIT